MDEQRGISKSPTRSVPLSTEVQKLLTFDEAVTEMLTGKKVTKTEWNNKETSVFLQDETLMIKTKGVIHYWVLSTGDLVGTDYIVVNT